MSITRAQIVAAARGWIGVRWKHQGRSRAGVDCIGLAVCVRADLGLDHLDAAGYGRTAEDERMLDFCRQHMRPVAMAQIQPGDVLVMAQADQRHMAIVADYPGGGLSLVHAYAGVRSVVEMRLDAVWRARIRGAFAFPEIGD